jgi:hypothetical protein
LLAVSAVTLPSTRLLAELGAGDGTSFSDGK